ncbi:MAG: translesion error-prone DNA polymerase V autoproteolytic subunit [Candidatus Abawacabacteria bacterium]|nr:translesion error-prone DNA polymerase V autoproteolytic subunit [Candidatus Abawacabacteria bacterium]
MCISFLSQPVYAGFPSPAEDYEEAPIDLEKYLINNKAATFLGRVAGNSMRSAGFFANDILVIDRSLVPHTGQIIVGRLESSFVVKFYHFNNNKIILRSADQDFPEIIITAETDFELWGVVTGVVRKVSLYAQ